MHWVFISSFHVAIKSLLWDRLLRSWIFFLLVGQTGSSFVPCTRLASAGSGFIWDTNRKWVEFGMRGQWGVQLERTWANVMHHYSSVTAEKKRVQIMCICVDRVFFGYCSCVLSINWWPSICVMLIYCTPCKDYDHNAAVCFIEVETRCVLNRNTGSCWLLSCHTHLELSWQQRNSAAAVLLLGIMGEGDEQFKTSWIKGLETGHFVCECMPRELSVCVCVLLT